MNADEDVEKGEFLYNVDEDVKTRKFLHNVDVDVKKREFLHDVDEDVGKGNSCTMLLGMKLVQPWCKTMWKFLRN